MPQITIHNSTGGDFSAQDHNTGFAVHVAAGQTKVLSVDGNVLRGLAAQLNAEQTAGKITWSTKPDAANPADDAALGAGTTFASGVRAATGALESIAHGLGQTPQLVIVSLVAGPEIYAAPTITEGAHDATNLKVTVTSGWSYKIVAFA